MGCKASKGAVTERVALTDVKQPASGKETGPERAVSAVESPATASDPNLSGQGATEAPTTPPAATPAASGPTGAPTGTEPGPDGGAANAEEADAATAASAVDCTTDQCGFNEWHQAVQLDELALALKLNCLAGQGTPKPSSV